MDSAAAEQNQHDEVRVGREGLDDQHGNILNVHMDVLNVVEGGGVNNFLAGHRVFYAGVLAAGDDPGQGNREQDDDQEDDKGMGHGEAFLLCLQWGFLGHGFQLLLFIWSNCCDLCSQKVYKRTGEKAIHFFLLAFHRIFLYNIVVYMNKSML